MTHQTRTGCQLSRLKTTVAPRRNWEEYHPARESVLTPTPKRGTMSISAKVKSIVSFRLYEIKMNIFCLDWLWKPILLLLLFLLFHLITAFKIKITFSFVPVTPRVGLCPISLDLKGLSQDPRCNRSTLTFILILSRCFPSDFGMVRSAPTTTELLSLSLPKPYIQSSLARSWSIRIEWINCPEC